MRVPDTLRSFQAFTLWRLVGNPDPSRKNLKVPVHYDGITNHSRAKPAPLLTADQAEQWLAYNRATGVGHDRAGEPGYLGIGFRPSPINGVVVLDLDDQLDSPILPWFAGAGTEISHSGKGLHIFARSSHSADIGRRGQVQTPIGKMELYADGQFIALGTWQGGDATVDMTVVFDTLLATYWPTVRHRTEVMAPDWDEKTEVERATAVADLRSALRFYDPNDRDEWVSAGQALACLGDLGRDLWIEWGRTSTRFPDGSTVEEWDARAFSGERSDYRAIFARAQTRGWSNPARIRDMPETVFTAPPQRVEGPTPAATAALHQAVERVQQGAPVAEATFEVARMSAGGQIPWEMVKAALPAADTAVLERAKLAPLTAVAQAAIDNEQVKVSAQVGWLRDEGIADASAVLNERALAFRMNEAHPGELRRLTTSEDWIRWEDGRWTPWVHEQVRDLCMHEVPVMLAREMISLAGVGATDYLKMAVKAATTATSGNVASTWAYLPGVLIEPGAINRDPMLCGMNGGRQILDLRTGTLRPATREDFVTRNLGPASIGRRDGAALWVKFLHEVFEGDVQLIDWVHRFVGYMLTGHTDEHVFLFLFGHGSNGKSVFVSTIEALMGEYGRSLQPTSLCDDKRSAGAATADLASLDGMRLVTSPEAEEGSKFSESLLKGMVSGDKMPVRQLYGKPYDMTPAFKLVLTGNHKPTIRGSDDGIWRRVRLVPFKANFQGREDTQLTRKLRETLPDILAWAIEGCQQWQARGLRDVPVAVQQATAEYRDEMDTLGEWLTDECEHGGQEDSAMLYANYRAWCDRVGIKQIWPAKVFGRKLGEYTRRGWNIQSSRTSSARVRVGVHLKNSVFLPPPK